VGRLGPRELCARERLGRLAGRAQGAAHSRGRQASGAAAALQADPRQAARRWAEACGAQAGGPERNEARAWHRRAEDCGRASNNGFQVAARWSEGPVAEADGYGVAALWRWNRSKRRASRSNWRRCAGKLRAREVERGTAKERERAGAAARAGQSARLGSRHRCGWSRHCTGTDVTRAGAGQRGPWWRKRGVGWPCRRE
jgi:hypothetical protein